MPSVLGSVAELAWLRRDFVGRFQKAVAVSEMRPGIRWRSNSDDVARSGGAVVLSKQEVARRRPCGRIVLRSGLKVEQ